MKRYKVSNPRVAGFLAALLVYAGISLYASLGIGASKIAMGIAIHLSLSAVNSVVLLWLLFKPLERIETNEKAQTVHDACDCGSGHSHT